ncbi:MAG: pyruvate kinase [Planctomycetota bacterium]|nr:MAG: pyruvate kinase [Planctomycetota bacterium]
MTADQGSGLRSAGGSDIKALLEELASLRECIVADAAKSQAPLEATHPSYRDSARNLLHYLGLRRHDLRPLQLRLAALGLSSLGRAESHVLATVDAVLDVLHRLARLPPQPPSQETPVDFAKGERLLAEHTEALLGRATHGRVVRIMVTMPSEAAHDQILVRKLLQQGMDCMRINCAHDDAATWLRMIEQLRRAEHALGRSCRVVMDLAGPKLRTGPMPGPAVVRVRPLRDAFGRVTAPARVWLSAATSASPPAPADACLPVPGPWLAGLRAGEELSFTDARDAQRCLVVADVTEAGCWAEASATAYIVQGTVLRRTSVPARDELRDAAVGELPAVAGALRLHDGDTLVLTRDLRPGRAATLDSAGRVLTPAQIGCTMPEVFEDVRSGESIWFDDGKIGGVIESVDSGEVRVRVTHARPGGAKLGADKGINLPDSQLRLGALSEKDLEDLDFVARHADVVELSFANSARDVELLQQHLASLGHRPPAVVLKIETRRGFESLPDMLLAAMRWPCCGVMIARGDLAVECGFERLAEVQEEILWICEAAHVPVIWATQVLETLAKKGVPSRAEITDAAMGHRAECVMLNKGPHVLSAVTVLDDILRRMQAHQAKKRAMLRQLRLACALPSDPHLGSDLYGALASVPLAEHPSASGD